MKLLAVIPARGGSKGIPGKNIIELAGKPLIAWTIEAAKAIPDLSILVSTDDEAIAKVAAEYGVATAYRRPAELSSDTATTLDAILHGLAWCQAQGQLYDAVLLLQPTSPLRTTQHIQEAIAQWQHNPQQPLVSVCEPSHPPYLLFQEQGLQQWQRLVDLPQGGRRQDMTQRFAQLNGAIYLQSVQRLQQGYGFFEEGRTQFYFMPTQASIDIDTSLDLSLARLLLSSNELFSS
ncbi:MAG: acylneuraminate cytidylyltransferase family protein [Gammaproteobacteria bacterium]|nr:acylneuraminate cytidylyltransferase family protein [Gammaproteobacteria bacterium]